MQDYGLWIPSSSPRQEPLSKHSEGIGHVLILLHRSLHEADVSRLAELGPISHGHFPPLLKISLVPQNQQIHSLQVKKAEY